MQPSYIPAPDAAFDAWFDNFQTLLTAAPTDFGLIAGDAVIVAASFTAWSLAYLPTTIPSTRTSPAIAAKDAQRILSEQVLRPYAQQISRNPAVLNADKTAIGVNLPNAFRPRIPAPTTVPGLSLVAAIHFVHTLAFRDTSTPTVKAKPFGAIGMELWRVLATTPSSDPTAAALVGIYTKSPLNVGYGSPDVGKTATYWGRWTTKSGPSGQSQQGPFSAPLSVNVI